MRLLRRSALPVLMIFFLFAGVSCKKIDAAKHNNKGVEYAEQGMLDEAISEYERAIEIDPEFHLAYYNRGNAYSDKYHHDRAISDYTRTIEIDPKYLSAYFNRALAYEDKRQYDRAESDYTKVIEIDPKYLSAYVLRGQLYMTKLDEEMKGCTDWSMACDLGDCKFYERVKKQARCR